MPECPNCPVNCSEKCKMSKQIATVHVIKNKVQCSYCLSQFNNNYTMKEHIIKVHERSKLECPLCPARFGRSSDLKRHIKKFHTKDEIFL